MGSSSSIDAPSPQNLRFVAAPGRPRCTLVLLNAEGVPTTTPIARSNSADLMDVVELQPEDVTGAVLKDSPEKCTVAQLQRWLECRRKKQGVKAVLVQMHWTRIYQLIQIWTMVGPTGQKLVGKCPLNFYWNQQTSPSSSLTHQWPAFHHQDG